MRVPIKAVTSKDSYRCVCATPGVLGHGNTNRGNVDELFSIYGRKPTGTEIHPFHYISPYPYSYQPFEYALHRLINESSVMKIQINEEYQTSINAVVSFYGKPPTLIPAWGAYKFEAQMHLDRQLHALADEIQSASFPTLLRITPCK